MTNQSRIELERAMLRVKALKRGQEALGYEFRVGADDIGYLEHRIAAALEEDNS